MLLQPNAAQHVEVQSILVAVISLLFLRIQNVDTADWELIRQSQEREDVCTFGEPVQTDLLPEESCTQLCHL